ncbi:hypothetical protein HQ529_02165 [Candidatus Woesearchaeota archaeon]|nr:hypothetical protein [Candidatus Woesearchaeota archaeon]
MDEQKETLEQIKERMTQMRDRLKVLEWDDQHKQINPYKKMELESMKKEYNELQNKLTEHVIEA